MNKNNILFLLFISLLFIACDKSEEDIKTERENNWFEIPERSGELGQLLHSIYKDSEVSIFVNDTLGCTYKGEDAYGQPIYEYSTVSEKYYIYGTRERIRFVLSSDTSAMLKAVKAIKNWVIPNLPSEKNGQRIKSILLTDSLLWSMYGGDTLKREDARTAWVSTISVETLPVGRLCDIKQMDYKTFKYWAGMMLSVRSTNWIMSNCPDEMEEWIDITWADRTMKKSFFGNGSDYIYYLKNEKTGELADGPGSRYYQDSWTCYKKGFLEWCDGPWEEPDKDSPGWIKVNLKAPTQTIDMMNYVAAVYAFSDEEFAEMFKGVEGEVKILKKRELMKKLLNKFETKFEVTRHPFTSFE